VTELHDLARDRLAGAEQRYTTQRRQLVATLADAEGPLSITDILAGAPGLAQSSAYRNLAVLEQAGVVSRIVTSGDHARYELSEDLTDHHHHHLICSVCGRVDDFTVPHPVERALATAIGEVAGSTGFLADHHRLDLIGRCSDCARPAPAERRAAG
jgi:Fur family transcriptional regulator, ferric uptake regulator